MVGHSEAWRNSYDSWKENEPWWWDEFPLPEREPGDDWDLPDPAEDWTELDEEEEQDVMRKMGY